MPKDLPGFYYDREKNRYFSVKGPIPNCKYTTNPPSTERDHASGVHGRRMKAIDLLQVRELHGKKLMLNEYQAKFETEYLKAKACQPLIWKYDHDSICEAALEQVNVDIQVPQGQKEVDALLTGSDSGIMRFFIVGKSSTIPNLEATRRISTPYQVSSFCYEAEVNRAAHLIWTHGVSAILSSSISCIRNIGNYLNGAAKNRRVLVTTRGSGIGGEIYVFDLSGGIDCENSRAFRRRITRNDTWSDTIWTAECSPDGTKAAIGMNSGSSFYDLETGRRLWICRSRSAVFSLQFDLLGNVLLCGFRNGAIVPIDIRARSATPLHARILTERPVNIRFRGKLLPSSVAFTSSAVCSLVSLHSYDQYLLASCMDGTMKLYDCRMNLRVLQSYEGHENTHSHLQIGVDPSESLLLSGGQDGYLRIWSILSGQLLSARKISNDPLPTVCISKTEGLFKGGEDVLNCTWGAWVGSYGGLYNVQG